MRTAVLTSAEEVFALKPQWDELHRRTSAPVSMSFTWLSIWWDRFGSRFEMRTFAVPRRIPGKALPLPFRPKGISPPPERKC